MKRINYNYDEVIYEEKLDNGLKILLYPTNKTKNFYITVSTHFGAEVMKYKKNDKVYEVTKGSAHFLEHRVMDFTKNKKAMEKISEYGSLVNAYTTYNGTNYNIFGNEKIIDNMTMLFDAVFKAKIRKEDVYEHLEMLYEIVGDEKYLEIIRMYGGSNLYIPTYKATIRNSRNREIRKRYNGVNLSLLAAEYGMSVNNLRNIVKGD